MRRTEQRPSGGVRAVVFTSVHFLVFFALVTLLYFGVPARGKIAVLLIASCIFYMDLIPIYILALLFTIIVDYLAGLLMDRTQSRVLRRAILGLSFAANLGLLAYFKYWNFFQHNLALVSQLLGLHYREHATSLLLPVGLSFHTFQAMSYTIEVYRGNQKAETNFWIYSLYVMFYPQLVAGPIERPQNLLHQFHSDHKFCPTRVTAGLQRMLWGFFQKVVVADGVAPVVNRVFNSPYDYQGITLWSAAFLFAVQIYCDFNGYCDIALGAAKVMDYELMENFRRPYFSQSISEFWNRWHISLSTWFRDYVYIPLGGNRVGPSRRMLNLFIVFFISGLWHGANYTFLAWGVLNWLYIALEVRFGGGLVKKAGGGRRIVRMLRTFILTCFAWIFFRANSIREAFYLITHLFTGVQAQLSGPEVISKIAFPGQSIVDICFILFGLAILLSVQWLQEVGYPLKDKIQNLSTWKRWSIYYAGAVMIFFSWQDTKFFIYFQF